MKKLSSSSTIFYQTISPAIFLALGIFFIIRQPSIEFGYGFTAIAIITFVTSIRFKAVYINQDNIIIKGFFKKSIIPISNIEKAIIDKSIMPYPIKIVFSNNTEIGKKVSFMPYSRKSAYKELTQAISNAKQYHT